MRTYQTVDVAPVAAATSGTGPVPHHLLALMLRNQSSDGYVFADPVNPGRFSLPGCIIASPSYLGSSPTADQDYVFNWTRDAAVTAIELVAAGLPTTEPVADYVRFARACQLDGPPIGYGAYTVSARKRPDWSEQTDGPALRVVAVLRALPLLDDATRQVAAEVIATDLAYLLDRYREPTVNLWEERRGHSFFARAVQRRCFAEVAGNGLGIPVPDGVPAAIEWLTDRLAEHWNPEQGLYVTFAAPPGDASAPVTPGYDPNVDILMAAVYGDLDPADPRLLATAERIRAQWADPGSPLVYPINLDDAALGVGPLFGRYPQDHYDGDTAPPNEVGHPWVPCTANVAELYFRLAGVVADTGTVPHHELSGPFWTRLGVGPDTAAPTAARLLVADGDRLLAALIRHSDHLELSEQFDRVTGYEKSVANLTWSYAAYLSALRARPQLPG